ncbi:MAG: TonB-dependent receptor [Alphaproteobacteria bacterium]
MKQSAILGAALVFFYGGVSLAQTPEVEPQQVLDAPASASKSASLMDEIVITAQKREQGQQDVGIAVSAFSGDALERIGVEDTTELAHLIPGFNYSEGRGGVPIYTLRGVGFNLAMSTASSTVGIYVDEMNIPYSALSVGANLDVDRVEVVKGPQGTLYGRNTTGGAVNYVARKPGDEWEYGLRAELRRFLTSDVEAYAGGPLTDKIGIRFAVRNTRSEEGWQYDYTRNTNNELGFVDKTVARLITQWDVSEDIDLSFTLSGWRDQSDSTSPQYYAKRNQAGVPVFAPSPEVTAHEFAPEDDARATAYNPENDYQQDNWYYSAFGRFDWTLSDSVDFALLVSHQDYQADGLVNVDGLNVSNIDFDREVTTNAQSLEARFSGALGDEGIWVAGYWYSQDDVDSVTLLDSSHNSIGNGGMITTLSEQSSFQQSQSHAGFGQAEWQLTDTLRLTTGARYTWENRDHQACITDDGDATILLSLIALGQQVGAVQALGPILAGTSPAGTTPEQQAIYDAIKLVVQSSGTQQPTGQILSLLLAGGLGDAAGQIPGINSPGECSAINSENNIPELLDRSLTEDNISFRVAVDWTPSDQLLLYGSVARGYKSGTFSDLVTSSSDLMQPVTQEELWAYEVGLKSEFYDRALTVNAAAFYYDYREKQLFGFVVDPIFGPLEALQNIPKAEVWGAEFETRLVPLENLFVSLSAAYTHTEVLEYVGIGSEGTTEDFSGNSFAYSPEWEVAGMVHYTIPVGNAHGLSLSANANYQSSTEGELSNDPTFKRDGYALVNAQLSYGPDDFQWEVRGFVNNIFDQIYFTSQSRASDVAIRYTGMPRVYGLSLTYHFR